MRALAALLSALLLLLPCASSLPALCAPGSGGSAAVPACCQHRAAACAPVQPEAYCCPTESSPATAASEAALPAPGPAPELYTRELPAPVLGPCLVTFQPAPPPDAPRPALYLLHRSFRS